MSRSLSATDFLTLMTEKTLNPKPNNAELNVYVSEPQRNKIFLWSEFPEILVMRSHHVNVAQQQ